MKKCSHSSARLLQFLRPPQLSCALLASSSLMSQSLHGEKNLQAKVQNPTPHFSSPRRLNQSMFAEQTEGRTSLRAAGKWVNKEPRNLHRSGRCQWKGNIENRETYSPVRGARSTGDLFPFNSLCQKTVSVSQKVLVQQVGAAARLWGCKTNSE